MSLPGERNGIPSNGKYFGSDSVWAENENLFTMITTVCVCNKSSSNKRNSYITIILEHDSQKCTAFRNVSNWKSLYHNVPIDWKETGRHKEGWGWVGTVRKGLVGLLPWLPVSSSRRCNSLVETDKWGTKWSTLVL